MAGSGISGGVSVKVARENREWQERMSNTAHVREVADLRNAGLNPMLSVMGGGGRGATTPPGNVAQIPDMGGAARSGVEMMLTRERVKTEQELQKNARDLRFQRGFQNALYVKQNEREKAHTQLFKAQAFHQQQMNIGARVEGNIDREKWAQIVRRINRGVPIMKAVGSATIGGAGLKGISNMNKNRAMGKAFGK